MAEIKNTFIKSKMNKDLDARLVPNGEYRDALNINVNKSEGADVGALENVLGNIKLTSFGIENDKAEIIGYYMDTVNDSIYVFITDYSDSSFNRLSNFAPASAFCCIAVLNLDTSTSTIIVQGNYLNFSKTHPIVGVSMLEELFFFTDNRNQPRKINTQKAIQFPLTYYTNEDQISVAKYYPFKPLRFWKNNNGTIESTMKDVVSEFLPVTLSIQVANNTNNSTTFSVGNPPQQLVWQNAQKFNGSLVKGSGAANENIPAGTTLVTGNTTPQTLELSQACSLVAGTTIKLGLNPDYDPDYAGDERFLAEKFIKLAYRFKFDDNEYSLISPFSPTLFVPKQDGYILNENRIATSAIVQFFENKINEIGVQIDAPEGVTNFSEIIDTLHVDSIEILFKDSADLSIKVLDTIPKDELQNITGTTFEYKYLAQKPITTLPEKEISRVSDVVPIRALTQETIGNRIVYGNFVAQTASLPSLDYNVNISEKLAVGTTNVSTNPYLRREFQNHSLKQNRTYQVGIVLVDRYGRMSDVILSSNDSAVSEGGFGVFGGSSVYSFYRESNNGLFDFPSGSSSAVADDVWPGDSLKILFNSPIPNSAPTVGYQGLYSSTNPLGWYSYKIVVKQQEQEYYNSYLPSILNGFPITSSNSTTDPDTAHIVLTGDNINKIPRELNDIGQQDRVYGSDKRLFGRVNNGVQFYPSKLPDTAVQIGTMRDLALNQADTGAQFEPLNVVENSGTYSIASGNLYNYSPFYNIPGGSPSESINFSVPLSLNEQNLIARLSTEKAIGGPGGHIQFQVQGNTGTVTPNYVSPVNWQDPQLSVYEGSPDVSVLDIYFETPTGDLISKLNLDVITGDTQTPASLQPINFSLAEDAVLGTVCTTDFYPLDAGGNVLNNNNTDIEIVQVLNGLNNDIKDKFEVIKNQDNSFRLRTLDYFVYVSNSPTVDNYEFTFKVSNGAAQNIITIDRPNLLTNVKPSWTNNSGNTPYDLGNKQPQVVSTPNSYCALVQLDGKNGSAGTLPYQYKAGLIWKIKPNTLEFEWTALGIWAAYTDQTAIQIINALGQASRLIPETIVHDTRSLNVNDSSNPYIDYFNTQNTNFRVTLQLVDASDNGGIQEELVLNWTITTPNTAANACNVIT